MSDRAFVQQDFARLGLSIYLVQKIGDQRYALAQPTDLIFSETEPAVQTEPTLRIPESMARALLDALAAHFGGTSEVQTLRRDYMAERARVDKMIDYLTRSAP